MGGDQTPCGSGGPSGKRAFVDELSNYCVGAYIFFGVLYLLANLIVNFLPLLFGSGTPLKLGTWPGTVWEWLYYISGALTFVLSYLSYSLSYYILGRNRGLPSLWRAWIPLARGFLMGELIGSNLMGIGHVGAILCFTPLAALALGLVITVSPEPLSGFLVLPTAALAVFSIIYRCAVLYKLYRIYRYSEFDAAVGIFIEFLPYINVFFALFVCNARYRTPEAKLLDPPDWRFR